MRKSVKKHYQHVASFVGLANLGWNEILLRDRFPLLVELEPLGEHRALLKRIDHEVEKRLPAVRELADVPALFFSRCKECSPETMRQVHSFALVRRVFDSLNFLTGTAALSAPGAQFTQFSLQVKKTENGSLARVHDPYEDFLIALEGCDLRRLLSCPVCRRFFVAFRLDQKACSRGCANRLRVSRFRKKQPEYLANRKFRKRTGLKAVRRGRHRITALHRGLIGDA